MRVRQPKCGELSASRLAQRRPARAGVLLLSIALFIPAAQAGSNNGLQEVVGVGIHDSGHAMVTLSAADNTERCATPGHEKLVVFDKSHPHFRLFYATAVTALASGKKAYAWVNGCIDIWGDGKLKVPMAITFGLER